MRGQDHYREAEELLAAAADYDASAEQRAHLMAAAQVHATLALVIATAPQHIDWHSVRYPQSVAT